MTKLQEKSPLVILTCWSLNIARDLGLQGQKGSRIFKLDIASEKTMRVDNKRCKRRLPKWRKWWSAWQKEKGLLMIPVYKENEKTHFLLFSKIQNTFFWQVRKNFFLILMMLWNLLTQKQENFFQFFLTENNNTRVSALLSTCKRNMRTKVSLHMI